MLITAKNTFTMYYEVPMLGSFQEWVVSSW